MDSAQDSTTCLALPSASIIPVTFSGLYTQNTKFTFQSGAVYMKLNRFCLLWPTWAFSLESKVVTAVKLYLIYFHNNKYYLNLKEYCFLPNLINVDLVKEWATMKLQLSN